MSFLNLLPDGGRSATRIPPPRSLRVTVPKPRSLPVFRQPDGGLYAGGQYPRLKAPPVKKPGIKLSYPTLATPKLSNSSGAGGGTGISLPGTGNLATMSSMYSKTQAQLKTLAKQAVLLEVNPQIGALVTGKKQENINYSSLISQLSKQLGLSKGDVKGLYDSLDVALAVNAQKQQAINTDTKAKIGTVYNDLNSQLGTNYSKAQAATSSELGRLGIQQPQANDRLTADQQFLQGQAQTSKTNSQSLLDAINASTQGVMQGLRGGNAATSAMLQSGLQQQFDKTSADALTKHIAKMAEINNQVAQLKASVPSKINQTYSALLDQQYQREMDAAQRLFDNQIKLGNLGVSQQNASTTQQYRQNQLALEAQKLAQSSTKKPAGKPLSGMDKSLAYLQQVAAKSHVPYSQLEALLIDAINGGDKADYPGFNKDLQNRYGVDIKNATAARGYPQLYSDVVKAMNYWFGA